jgi:hypothetical protein
MIGIIDTIRSYIFFKLLTIYLRYLIGFAFVFASVVKIQGKRFTSIPPTEPIGYFFEAMYQTGYYWNFLGWCQFIAGALLVTQRFATIGAFVFLPIILNVFMITHSIDFGLGTPLITTLMLLGTVYLLMWDYRKWVILFYKDQHVYVDLRAEPKDNFTEDPLWAITGILFVVFSTIPWIFNWEYFSAWVILMITTGVAALVLVFIRHRTGRRGLAG